MVSGRRYGLARNPEQARKDAETRNALLAGLERKLAQGDKALVGNAGYRRFLADPQAGSPSMYFQLGDDLEETVRRLRDGGARFRNDIVTGVGGKQVLVEDPAGNPVELFEPTRDEARLSAG